jgi:hypothetical protein
MTIVTELLFLPPISAFRLYKPAADIVLEGCEHYQKGSYRNRCHIAGANGVQRLSLPLAKGKHSQQPIREVLLSYDEPWPQQHWQSIRSAYGNAPYFIYYADALEAIFHARHPDLWSFNLALLTFAFRTLRWDKPITITAVYQTQLPPDVLDLRNRVTPKTAAPTVHATAAGAYPQVFQERHGFVDDLSILDLIFCAGPEANRFL